MKNKIYYLGLVITMLVIIGCLFKLMHWAGAGIVITLGIFFLCFVFIPSAFISSYRSENNRSQQLLYIIIAVVFIISFISALFKIMHWPGAGILMIISLPLPFILILPVYLIFNRIEKEINYKNLLAILFFFAYFAVISALLSISISKNVINGYISSANQIQQKTEILTLQCQLLQKEMMNCTEIENSEKTTLQHLDFHAAQICMEIDSLEQELIKNQNASMDIFNNGKINMKISKLFDAGIRMDLQTGLLKLKSDLIDFKNSLAAKSKSKENLNKQSDLLINTSDDNNKWEINFIRDNIIISGIEQLCLLKYQVRLVELDKLTQITYIKPN